MLPLLSPVETTQYRLSVRPAAQILEQTGPLSVYGQGHSEHRPRSPKGAPPTPAKVWQRGPILQEKPKMQISL